MRGSAQTDPDDAAPAALRAAWQGLSRPVHPGQEGELPLIGSPPTEEGTHVSLPVIGQKARRMMHGSERRARGRHLTIRLSVGERAKIDTDAERAGLMSGSYARRVLLGAEPPRQMRRPAVERTLLARLLGELGRVGSNLNQLAREVNRGDSVDRIGLAEDLRDLRRLRDAILQALGRAP